MLAAHYEIAALAVSICDCLGWMKVLTDDGETWRRVTSVVKVEIRRWQVRRDCVYRFVSPREVVCVVARKFGAGSLDAKERQS